MVYNKVKFFDKCKTAAKLNAAPIRAPANNRPGSRLRYSHL